MLRQHMSDINNLIMIVTDAMRHLKRSHMCEPDGEFRAEKNNYV